MQRDDEDFRFDYVIEKLMNNPGKFVLKSSKLAFTSQRAAIIFESLLTVDQVELLLSEAKKQLKRDQLTERDTQEWLEKQVTDMRRRTNRKDKETALRLLNLLTRLGLDLDNSFSYLARHTPKDCLSKQEFLLLYQSL
jgi:hypothetical protein